ncbi:UDP-3-O-(3-hydroxymyristoyl)glucosamine N-acyltransferase [Tichowtungia aerotolerans]|uniref:UDP-3-O-acylglucosamine N-acyltransferase n=1 Tax=Tichowtungia aerotolerans TaxID=2697043 RepID=A0A6P1M8R8_9BACT|nr:UDP-3-O-(3-hydroxymyristoyl)glucosamine N-acyltransferase [Tichowtungia aerotolerans]QHI68508.1 UDP-3-O-(3-hydroxymyristoyl)glucosamine N-acyltransferase [Tichowtungia aerotolerans]
MKLSELTEKIGGLLEGDGNVEICGVAAIDEATADQISFVANPKYALAAAATTAGAVIVPEDWSADCSSVLVRCKNPDAAFASAAALFYTPVPRPAPGVHPTAVVAEDVELGEGVSVGPYCVIEPGVKIGSGSVISAQCYIGYRVCIAEDSFLYPQVSIREGAEIGSRVIIHNGTVVGSDGFGYSVDADGVRTKINQIGIVQIGNDVEIGANVCIDRARFGKTRIGNGVKIDNLVQIAHNVTIGDHAVIIAQVGIAGSTTIGDRVILAGQAAVAGHLKVGAGAVVAGKAGVSKDVPPGEYVMGMPAMPAQKFKRNVAASMLLPKLKDRVAVLEKRIRQLEGNASGPEM